MRKNLFDVRPFALDGGPIRRGGRDVHDLGEAGNLLLRPALGNQMVDERGDGPFLRRRQICSSEPSRQVVLGSAPTWNVVASQLHEPSVLDPQDRSEPVQDLGRRFVNLPSFELL